MTRPEENTTRLQGGFATREGLTRLAAIAVIGLIVGVVLPSVVGLNRPCRPPTIPDQEPSEERRVYTPAGISIVRPPGWEVAIHREDGWSDGVIMLRFPEAFSASLFVRWSPKEIEREADSREIEFLGQPAWLKVERQAPNPWYFGSVRREGGQRESRGYLQAILVTSRGARWISLDFSCFGDHPEIPPMIWKYLESLECRPSDSATIEMEEDRSDDRVR